MAGINFSDFSVTTSGGAGSTTLTMNLPTNAQVGDLLVAYVTNVSTTSVTTTPPAVTTQPPAPWVYQAFTTASGASAKCRMMVYSKIHTSGTTWTGTFAASSFYVCHIAAYSNASNAGVGLTLSLPAATTSSATMANQSTNVVTRGIDWGSTAFATGFTATGTWTASTGTLHDSTADGSGSIWVYQALVDSGAPPPTGAWSVTGTSSNTTTDRVAASCILEGTRIPPKASNQAVYRSNRF